jgi:cytochrome d ubiquinol oxidase subunit I
VHLGCVWAFSLASVVSAYFILAANSWMQHPVGVVLVDGKPRLTSIWAVLSNPTLLAALPHTVAGCFAVAATFLVGIAAWQIARSRDRHEAMWRASLKLGAWVGVIAFAALAYTGDTQGKLMFQQQPMKMAAAEALCHTEQPAAFSVFAYGDVSKPNCESVKSLDVPNVLSFLATGSFSSKVEGVQDLIPQYQAKYGTNYPNDPALGALAGKPIDYVPDLPVTYWGFRLMIGFGALAALAALGALWLTRRGRFPKSKWFPRAAVLAIATPYLANAFGWIFTEMGRQPWVVAPNPTGIDGVWLYTAEAVSPGVTAGEALTSVIALTAVYAVLAVIEIVLMVRYVRSGVDAVLPDEDQPADDVLTFAY